MTRHYAAVRRFLAGKLSPDECRDVLQESFLTLCERRGGIKDRSNFRGFLFGVVRWKLIEHIRRKQKFRRRFDPMVDAVSDYQGPTLSSLLANKENERLVVRALRRLSLDDQILIELKCHERMTSRDLAQVFDVAEPSVRRRLQLARGRLDKQVVELQGAGALATATISNLNAWIQSLEEHCKPVLECAGSIDAESGGQ